MPRAILLIDMDAFFASVEQARHPELRDRPVIVGGRAESRGVVSTASYEARACDVHTAMPMAQALRRCPQGVFLPVDMAAYVEAHHELLRIFCRFTDLVEPVSIDEAFLDVTGSRRLFGSPQAIARRIQRAARDELGLSCSIGIGPTKSLAKLAAELEKPGGLTTLTRADVDGRLRPMPVGDISGIGPVTVKRLGALGIATIGELQDAPLAVLEASFAKAAAPLKVAAFGGPDSPVRSERREPKSRGHEVTFAADTADPEFLQATLLDLSDRVASGLRREGYAGRTLVLRLRDSRFRTVSRQRTLSAPTNTTTVVYDTALALLAELHEPGRLLRLVGLTLTGLTREGGQTALDDSRRDRACDEAVDKIRERFGAQAVRRAATELAPYGRASRSAPDDPRPDGGPRDKPPTGAPPQD
jgi:DNA polymerase IV